MAEIAKIYVDTPPFIDMAKAKAGMKMAPADENMRRGNGTCGTCGGF